MLNSSIISIIIFTGFSIIYACYCSYAKKVLKKKPEFNKDLHSKIKFMGFILEQIGIIYVIFSVFNQENKELLRDLECNWYVC